MLDYMDLMEQSELLDIQTYLDLQNDGVVEQQCDVAQPDLTHKKN